MEAAGLECAAAEVSIGLRIGAGMSRGAVARYLCRGVTAAGWYVCFTLTELICTGLTGVSTEVTGLELEVADRGKAPSGRIKCKLLPTSITAVPKDR